jgi:hypothetical protein
MQLVRVRGIIQKFSLIYHWYHSWYQHWTFGASQSRQADCHHVRVSEQQARGCDHQDQTHYYHPRHPSPCSYRRLSILLADLIRAASFTPNGKHFHSSKDAQSSKGNPATDRWQVCTPTTGIRNTSPTICNAWHPYRGIILPKRQVTNNKWEAYGKDKFVNLGCNGLTICSWLVMSCGLGWNMDNSSLSQSHRISIVGPKARFNSAHDVIHILTAQSSLDNGLWRQWNHNTFCISEALQGYKDID